MPRRQRLPTEPFRVRVDRLLESGRGGAQHAGRALEVADALPGESVMARYLLGRRFRGQAQATEVLEPSPDRVSPRCPHFGVCSACSLQHLAPAAQLAYKQQILLDRLAAVGLRPAALLPPLPSETWHYRRKARLSVRYVEAKGRALVGFRERDGRFVADLRECHVLPESIGFGLGQLSALVGSLGIRESIPQIEVSCGDGHCALVFRHLEPFAEADLAALREYARTSGHSILLQAGGPDSVKALAPGGPDLVYALPAFGLTYRFQALDFIQVNAGLNESMIRQALALLQLDEGDRVLELFCGLGNFTLPMAQSCHSVVAVEGDPALVDRARDNAGRNGVVGAEFVHADLYGEDPGALLPAGRFDKVLLDPPRSGAAAVIGPVAATGAGRVLYVSCNPASLAEDARALVVGQGYRLVAAGVMDMFPHTLHVESMALFEKE